jgi:hypothetical protein
MCLSSVAYLILVLRCGLSATALTIAVAQQKALQQCGASTLVPETPSMEPHCGVLDGRRLI